MSTDENSKRGAGRRDVDQRLAVALAAGTPYRQAAREVGVAVLTISRRMDDAQFRSWVALERERLVSEVRGQLSATAPRALAVLLEVAEDTTNPPAARVTAAAKLLELVVRRKEITGPSTSEVAMLLREVVGLALEMMSDDLRPAFARNVKATIRSLA